jgi:hypothetical protein
LIDEEQVRRLFREAARLPDEPVSAPASAMVDRGRRSLRRVRAEIVAAVVVAAAIATVVPISLAHSGSSGTPPIHPPTPHTSPPVPQGLPDVPGLYLATVAASGPDDVWAAGFSAGPTTGQQVAHSVIFHFNGDDWEPVAHPDVDGIADVTAPSAHDAWALTDDNQVLRWNGLIWSNSPLSELPSGAHLNAISATTSGDAWIVGTMPAPSGGSNHQQQRTRTLTVHWNGTSWAVVPSPNPSPDINQGESVVDISPTDAWLVGDTQTASRRATLTMHWDGTIWSVASSPNPGDRRYLDLVNVADDGDGHLWAVGDYRLAHSPTRYRPLFLRLVGNGWRRAPGPANSSTWALSAISGRSPTELWASGGTTGGQTYFIDRHDAHGWTAQTLPRPRREVDHSAQLIDIVAISQTDAWATGQYFLRSGHRHFRSAGLLLHWNGTSWSQQELNTSQ